MKIRNRVFVKDKLEEGVQLKLDQKVAQWRESAEERLEELRSTRLWVP